MCRTTKHVYRSEMPGHCSFELRQLGAFSRKFCGSGKLSERHFRREDPGSFQSLPTDACRERFLARVGVLYCTVDESTNQDDFTCLTPAWI